MNKGFVTLVRECYRLTRCLPWRAEDGSPDWDDVKYQITKSASCGCATCELKYDAEVEAELARVGFVVATREADEAQKRCKALIVAW